MAWKIVKKGKRPEDETWRGDCKQCGAVAECARTDLDKIEYDQWENGEFAHAKCPTCGRDFVLYPKIGKQSC